MRLFSHVLGVLLPLVCLLLALASTSAAEAVTPTNPPQKPATKAGPGEQQDRPVPFRGTLKSIDRAGRKLVVGSRTFQAGAGTRFHKGGKPAHLEDGTPGEQVTGSYRKSGDNLVAVTVYFGGKGAGKKAGGATSKEQGL